MANTIGITGGIGSGKSVVSSLLELSGIPVYSADTAGRRLTDTSPIIRRKLQDLFGNDIYVDGKLDRKRVASLSFDNEMMLDKLNGIIHPVVRDDFRAWVAARNVKYCAMESAILYEAGFEKEVELVLMVYAPLELRISRVMRRDGMTEADVMRRMNSQMPDDIKREKADFVIVNDDIQPLIPQIDQFVDYLKSYIDI